MEQLGNSRQAVSAVLACIETSKPSGTMKLKNHNFLACQFLSVSLVRLRSNLQKGLDASPFTGTSVYSLAINNIGEPPAGYCNPGLLKYISGPRDIEILT